jgi:hypothetical protein
LDLAEVYTCSFQAFVTGDGATPHTNTVTGSAVDGDGHQVADADDATVTFGDVIPEQGPEIEVTKNAEPTEISGTGGVVTFTVSVKNTGPVTVSLESLDDDPFGDLTTTTNISSTTCVLPQELDLTEVYPCSFQAFVTGSEAITHTNVVTATAFDREETPATASDDAMVTFDELPSIDVTKTANITEIVGAGGVVIFTVAVENTGPVTVSLTSLVDNRFGDLTATTNISSTTCVLPRVLAVAEVYTCSFQAFITGNEATPHTNMVGALAFDKDRNPATDGDDATVTFDELPEINVTKNADPTTVLDVGGVVTFTVVVQNIGPVTVSLTTLNDNRFGDLATTTNVSTTTCILPQVLAQLAAYTCSFQAFVTGNETTPHTNTVTGTAVDGGGNQVTDSDDATVTFDELPSIDVTKTASPAALETIEGVVTFTVVVQNTGPVTVSLEALVDNQFGDLTHNIVISNTTCVLPRVLAVAEVYSCSFQALLAGTDATPHTNQVTGLAFDKQRNPANDTDDATVTFPSPTGLDETAQPGPRRNLFVPVAPR